MNQSFSLSFDWNIDFVSPNWSCYLGVEFVVLSCVIGWEMSLWKIDKDWHLQLLFILQHFQKCKKWNATSWSDRSHVYLQFDLCCMLFASKLSEIHWFPHLSSFWPKEMRSTIWCRASMWCHSMSSDPMFDFVWEVSISWWVLLISI